MSSFKKDKDKRKFLSESKMCSLNVSLHRQEIIDMPLCEWTSVWTQFVIGLRWIIIKAFDVSSRQKGVLREASLTVSEKRQLATFLSLDLMTLP